MSFIRVVAVFALAFSIVCSGQKKPTKKPAVDTSPPVMAAGTNAAAEDISGMYTFLHEGEFVQINLDENGVSGYISRQGEMESDRGQFLDQFFTKAAIKGHDVSFTTKPVHSVWFEFKGRYDRGPAKSKTEDGYYVLKGTLTQYSTDTDKNTVSRSREVEFKSLGQPPDDGG